jgi:ABC-type uncharacterized transport system substrate-binding protein
MKKAVTKVARIAVLYNPANPPSVIEVKEFSQSQRALELTVRSWEVRDADGFERVFAALNKQHPDGLHVTVGGPLICSNGKRIAGFALKSRLPSVYYDREFVDAAGSCPMGRTSRTGTGASILYGQNPEASQACRSACGTAEEV